MTNPFAEAAHLYRKRGWQVLPLHRLVRMKPPTCSCREGANCRTIGKHPIWSDWRNRPPLSGADIAEIWPNTGPKWNIGIITGEPSGFWALDVDPKNGGRESAQKLVRQHGAFPMTTVVRTGSGGFHYWFIIPEGVEITNSPGTLNDEHPGIDVRGTGGLVVAPPSVTHLGAYLFRHDAKPTDPPPYLVELVRKREVAVASSEPVPEVITPAERDRLDRYVDGAVLAIQEELRFLGKLKPGGRDPKGRGWEKGIADAAQRLGQLVRARWSTLTPERALTALLEAAPTDDGFTTADVRAKWKTQAIRGPEAPMPPRNTTDPFSPGYVAPQAKGGAAAPPSEGSSEGEQPAPEAERPLLDVSNPATMADWLREHLGTGVLSEIFMRPNYELVHVPRRGSSDYRPTGRNPGDDDGPAQVRPIDSRGIRSAVHYGYLTYKEGDKGRKIHTLFPRDAAEIAAASPHLMYNVKVIKGVTHSPVVRRDGSVLEKPGFDEASGLLYLPDPQLTIPTVGEKPTRADLAKAIEGLTKMLCDFPFVSDGHRANYYGMMLTPLLRNVAPSPYKMGLIEAHQPGSGKTFLARALMTLHGGVFRAEMPHDEAEMKKVLSAILDTTTAPVVIFDNASNVVRSSTLAGLLTTNVWEDRRLGFSKMFTAANDRLWVVTGNNVKIGGDLQRRIVRTCIDPGIPHPELRTNFTIKNFERWVYLKRGQLLWALLTLIRHWFAEGCPKSESRSSDSYEVWAATVNSILRTSGLIEAGFDTSSTRPQSGDIDADEWGELLSVIFAVKDSNPWTAKEILELVEDRDPRMTFSVGVATDVPSLNGRPIPFDVLPTELVNKRKSQNQPLSQLTKSFGRWISHREGRWAGSGDRKFCIQKASEGRGSIKWKVIAYRGN